jgi:hypothetical protein
MAFNPISLSRRHILGDLYTRCESLTGEVPVYLHGDEPELLGHVDEGLGHFADAFCFHLPEDVCKRLSSGQFTYSFDYEKTDPAVTGSRGRVILKAITLTAGKPYEKPLPKRR